MLLGPAASRSLRLGRRRHLAPDDDLAYVGEYEHVTLARILMDRQDPERPCARRAVAGRLGAAAEEGGRTGTLIEILVLQALARR